jgi:hypothetical protein
VLDVRLSLDGIPNLNMGLHIDETLELISFGEPLNQPLAMLVDSAYKSISE